MGLTKKQVFEIGARLWKWLYENPDRIKWDWPEWRYNGAERSMKSNCPCCEFSKQNGDNFCGDKCLLADIWGGGCSNPASPYEKWCLSKGIRNRRKYAKIIWQGFEKLKKTTGGKS